MLAKDLISEHIIPLRPSDTGSDALRVMGLLRVSHLPVVSQDEFVGMISDVDIIDKGLEDIPVGTYSQSFLNPFVFDSQHIYDVFEVVLRLDLTVIAVLNEAYHYLGSISTRELVQAFGDLMAMKTPGGVLVLELNAKDYSIAQIARIIEDNDAKLLSYYVTSPADSVKMKVTLKVDQIDLTSLIQTFIRYDYTIIGSYHSRNSNEDILRNNYEQLMMYMNV